MNDSVCVEPMDAYNETLVGAAHPADWVNPSPEGRYNMVVLGAGTAGLVTALGVAGLGGKVALIERHLMGGDCLNYGCVPSKSLIRSSRSARAIRDAERYGVHIPAGIEVDFAAVMRRMRRIRSRISEHDSAQRCRELGVDVFLGSGRFTGRDTVEVGGATLRFARACIATGARAYVPRIEGLEDAGYLTNETVFSLTERPGRLAVIGAGPLGCELAQTFARLGSRVTIVERMDHVLTREDPDAAVVIRDAMDRDGIDVRLRASLLRVRGGAGGKVLELDGEKPAELEVDAILIGAGRQPNVEGLALEDAGVEYDSRKGVHVDDHLRTTNKRIHAAGDICSRFKFTHTADASARIVIRNALFWGRRKFSALTIPWCTYTDPEVAHVGLGAHDAAERGIEVDTFCRPLRDVDRAVTDGEEAGFVKVHVRKGTDRIVGATIVASHAGEMISEITLAMTAGVGLGRIADVIHPYPTQADAIRQLGDLYNRTRLRPGIKKLFAKLLAWRR